MGRVRVLDETKLERLLEDAKHKTARQLARDYGVSLMTVYRLFETFEVKEWGKRRLNEAEIEKLITEVDTYTPAELAQKYGVATSTVYRILKGRGVRLGKSKTSRIDREQALGKPRTSRIDREQVLELYQQGHSLRSIAKQLSCSHERVRQIIAYEKQPKNKKAVSEQAEG